MEFRVLGPLEALDGGRALDLGAPRQRAVLAFLLLHANEVVSSDRLAEGLWPEGAPKTAAKAIQVYVSALRKAFGSSRDALETRGPGYVLRVAPGELDLHEFERLLAGARGEEPPARADTLSARPRALAWRAARGLRVRALRAGGGRAAGGDATARARGAASRRSSSSGAARS